jgi:flagellar protein FliS
MVTTTTNPLDLIIQLYDGAISRLNKTAFYMNKGDLGKKVHYLVRAIAIIEELLASLNTEEGGEVAQNLQELYVYMLKELTLANANNDVAKVKHVEALLRDLLTAWKQIR